VSEPGHGSPAKKGAHTDSKHFGEDNPIWRFPGFRIEAKRSWGLISTDIVSRGPRRGNMAERPPSDRPCID
jgi:hypothetical protein